MLDRKLNLSAGDLPMSDEILNIQIPLEQTMTSSHGRYSHFGSITFVYAWRITRKTTYSIGNHDLSKIKCKSKILSRNLDLRYA